METKKEIIKSFSRFRPICSASPWRDCQMAETEEKKREALELVKDWLEKNDKTPYQFNVEEYITPYIHWWKKPGDEGYKEVHERFLKSLNEREESKPIGGEDEYIYLQCGTSRCRAELAVEGEEGYVMLERGLKISGEYVRTGLQCSELGNHCRSEYARLKYYAQRQADWTMDEPAVLVFRIKKSYVFNEDLNCGEYSVPNMYFKYMEDHEILSLSEYRERFENKD